MFWLRLDFFIIQLDSYCLRLAVHTLEDCSDEHSLYAEVNVKTIETVRDNRRIKF